MQQIIEINKFELPDINKRDPSKKILEDKSNCVNTIKKFFNEDEEKVKNLKFSTQQFSQWIIKILSEAHLTSYLIYKVAQWQNQKK